MSITNGIFTLTGATVVATAVAYTPPSGSQLTGNLYSFDSSGSIALSQALSANKAYIFAANGGNDGNVGSSSSGGGNSGAGGNGGGFIFADIYSIDSSSNSINILVGLANNPTELNSIGISTLAGFDDSSSGGGEGSNSGSGGTGGTGGGVTIGGTTYYFSGGGGGGGSFEMFGGNGGGSGGGFGGDPGSGSASGNIGNSGGLNNFVQGNGAGGGGGGAGVEGNEEEEVSPIAGGGGGGGGGGYGGGGGGGAISNGVGGAGMPGIVFLFIVSEGAGNPPCFLRGSKILCLKDGEEQYTAIEEMRVGMEVKTLKGTYVKVHTIGKTMFNNPDNADRGPNRLFKLTPENYPELTEDLIITGCHSRLVVKLEPKQKARHLQLMKSLYMTTDMFRLMAFIDEKAEPYINPGSHEIWHFALENEVEVCNYGVYANGGLLVETASIKNMRERSGLALIE